MSEPPSEKVGVCSWNAVLAFARGAPHAAADQAPLRGDSACHSLSATDLSCTLDLVKPVDFAAVLANVRARASALTATKAAESATPALPPYSSPAPKRPYSSEEDDRGDFKRRDHDRDDRKDDDRGRSHGDDDGYGRGSAPSSRPRYGLGHAGAPSSSHYGPGGGNSDEPKISYEKTIPNNMAGLVIGRGGETLKRVERDCNVRIQFSSVNERDREADRTSTIIGSKKDVDRACEMIDDLMKSSSSSSGPPQRSFPGPPPPPPGSVTITMAVPSMKVGLVIGRGGEMIGSLQERSGAKIAVTPDSQSDRDANTRNVNLTGSDQAVQIARSLIEDLVITPGTVTTLPNNDDRPALKSHYLSTVSGLAKIFEEPLSKPSYDLEDFLDHTYASNAPLPLHPLYMNQLFDGAINQKRNNPKPATVAVHATQASLLGAKTESMWIH
ncbi:hypothetical protein BDK51DRAFT_46891 [Blyttiomyces helicus]|uniref:K Homology domain-containing protein n=1 Tax=Blyttiomyces helicus TaxID=388810 RepID=A0A4P9WF41_9FUNG|nr:hypothetical protein BDK51DRAFT_46891 [Blyttiomyces helicus]|eukprot:RKO89918.1 hypothetical protein BDK51DRAFT_46891 [Blyttiomyces helicus]